VRAPTIWALGILAAAAAAVAVAMFFLRPAEQSPRAGEGSSAEVESEPLVEPVACGAAPEGSTRLGAAARREFAALFRDYLQDDLPDRTRHRLELRAGLERWKKRGIDLFADLDGLTDVLYRARPFAPHYDKKMFKAVDKNAAFLRDKVNRIVSVSGKAHLEAPDPLRLSFSLPPSYPADADVLRAAPAFPTIVLLHDLVDFKEGAKSKEFPGAEAIRRRYPRQGAQKAVLDEWIVFAPVASDARFGEQVGRRVTVPFSDFWKRYHVDFDRVVLDGGAHALDVAAAMPVFLAGVILRVPTVATDPRLFVNFAHVPVYVVGGEDAPVGADLRKRGVAVTTGTETGLSAWLDEVRRRGRVVPCGFRWFVGDPDLHRLAHWINVNSPIPSAELKVKVDRATNTISIDAQGIEDLSLFLNDRIVDLSKPVKIVANGEERGPPKTFERKLDTMFEAERITIRRSRYFGWLYPVVLDALPIE
jgi:hypothetical protein